MGGIRRGTCVVGAADCVDGGRTDGTVFGNAFLLIFAHMWVWRSNVQCSRQRADWRMTINLTCSSSTAELDEKLWFETHFV